MPAAHGDRTNKHPLTVETADGARNAPRLPSTASGYSFIDMGKDFEFFTPAVIGIAGGFDRDIVAEYVKYHASPTADGDPFAIDYPGEPFFRGLGITRIGRCAADWDRRIYAIVRERWFHCRDWILGVCFVDPVRKAYARIGVYELSLVDPVASRRGRVMATAPTFPVSVFAVSSTQQQSWLDVPVGGGIPRLVSSKPDPATIAEATAVVVNEPDPHGLHKFKKP